MSNFKWQEKAISKQRILVRAPRQSGKTRAAIKWAGEAGEHVLYLTPCHTMVREIVGAFQAYFFDEIKTVIHAGLVVLKDDTHIHIAYASDPAIRGRNYDAVVLDEVNYISDRSVLNAFTSIKGDKLFATYTGVPNKTIQFLERMNGLERMDIDFENPQKNSDYKFLLENAY